MLADNMNLQYQCTLIHRESLHQFDNLFAQVVSMIMEDFIRLIFGLGMSFFPVNVFYKQK